MLQKKSVIMLSLALCSLSAFAATESISLGGSQDVLTMNAARTITKTEYTYEPYQGTCYDTVVIGSDNVCDTRYETRCDKVPGVGAVCHQEPISTCTTVDRTEERPYSCTQYMKVGHEVPDYDVNAVITVTKSAAAKNFDLQNCELGVTLEGSSEKFQAFCGSAIVKAKVVERKETISNRNKSRTIKLSLDFASAEPIQAMQAGLNSLNYRAGLLTFATANLEKVSNFSLSLNIVRNRFLLKDKVVVSKNLKSSDYVVSSTGDNKAKVTVYLAQLGGDFDSSKKHTVKVTLKTTKKVDLQGAINWPELKNELTETLVVNE